MFGIVVYSFGPDVLRLPVFLVVSLGSIATTVVGAVRNQPPGRRRPWWALAIAQAAFLGAAIIRLVIPGIGTSPPTPVSFLPDVLIIPAYLLIVFALSDMLRRRRAGEDSPAHSDAIVIGIGAALGVWTFLIAPAVGSATVPSLAQAMAAFFPVVDVLILVIVARLVMADGVRTPALWLHVTAGIALFTGDMLYAIGESGLGSAHATLKLFDALFLAAFVATSAAALHPSMRTLAEPQTVVVRDMGIIRTAGIAAVLVTPTVMSTVSPSPNVWNNLVRVALALLLTVTIVSRIVRSNNSRTRAERAERHRATHDSLTDLPNKELLIETITQWCDRAIDEDQKISLLFIDMDRFKVVNDSMGHRVGDELLCTIAGRLSAIVRSEDLVCHLGADEFVIALASPSHSDLAKSLAQRLIKDFADPFPLSTGDVIITPSVGVAQAQGAIEALELIRESDTAMYRAKESGGNRVAFYDTSLRERARARVAMEQALRGALGRGELSVHYQPIIDLAGEEIAGFEALMRWHHPDLGVVSPVDFIPVAEDTGLIVASGAWLMEDAARQLVSWQAGRDADLPDLHVSVNVSVRQLRDNALLDVVRGILDRTGLSASSLWLEVTESGTMEDPEVSIATLTQLRDLGTTVCIDDFGTGHSSLSYLNRLPAAIVKIDRSLITDCGSGSRNEPIVQTVIAMAHNLDRRVVAEGVETAVERDWLRGVGCDMVQGYLYGAPRKASAQDVWKDRAILRPSVASMR
ncbi:MAG: diguanylate cyclase [Micromonosporaceae bacterium]|nr:diguanylate cyclase [Micromonosporaceae bacterium]